MYNRDTIAHMIREAARGEVRDQFRRLLNGRTTGPPGTTNGSLSSGGGSFVGTDDSAAAGGGGDGTGPPASEGVDSNGTDYSVWPLADLDFPAANDRLLNLDAYVGTPFVTVMRGLVSDGGHQHSGIDGDAPPVPATAVLLPTGHLGAGTTAADHLKDAALHDAPWLIEYYLTNNVAVVAGYAADDVDFDTSPYDTVRKTYRESVAGEFHWQTWGDGLVFRATLKIRNDGSDLATHLRIPAVIGSLKVRLKNSVGNTLITSQTADNHRLNLSLALTLKGGETNTIVLYGVHVGTAAPGLFWVTNEETDGKLIDFGKSLYWVA